MTKIIMEVLSGDTLLVLVRARTTRPINSAIAFTNMTFDGYNAHGLISLSRYLVFPTQFPFPADTAITIAQTADVREFGAGSGNQIVTMLGGEGQVIGCVHMSFTVANS